jgi:hypothetical protein
MRVWLDGDIVVFRAGFAAEKTAYYIPCEDVPGGVARFQYKKEMDVFVEQHGLNPLLVESHREIEPLGNALHSVKLMLYAMQDALQVSKDEITVCLSGGDNFRYHVAKTKPYKGNRDAAHRPTHEMAIKDYLTEMYSHIVSDEEEADDVIGIQHYRMWCEDPESSIIATLDKDLNMIPGLHYNFYKNESAYITADEADRFFWKQLLTGDPTDNIQGIPGMGPRGAEKLVSGVATADLPMVVGDAYKMAYKDDWRDVMTEMGRLIWIRRKPDEWWEVPLAC